MYAIRSYYAISGPLSGGAIKAVRTMAAWLVIAPLAVMLIFWGLNALRPAPAVYLLAWVVAIALVLALAQTDILGDKGGNRITSYNVCYTKLLRHLRSASAGRTGRLHPLSPVGQPR